MTGAQPGPDGLPRCPWALGPPDYTAYHDEEWGRPVAGETALFERLTLESFQSGLSWLTILRKREAFRAAFAGFAPERVATFTRVDVERLMGEASIVRNRRKIEGAVTNARAVLAVREHEGLETLFRSRPPRRAARPVRIEDVPARTAESAGLAKEFKARGFVLLGPTTLYAAMQACGVVDDHLAGCAFGADAR